MIQNNQGLTAANYLIRHKNGHMATEGLIALVENGFDFREKDKFGKTLEELIPMCQAMSCKQIDKVQSVIWNKKDYSEMKKDCETDLELGLDQENFGSLIRRLPDLTVRESLIKAILFVS